MPEGSSTKAKEIRNRIFKFTNRKVWEYTIAILIGISAIIIGIEASSITLSTQIKYTFDVIDALIVFIFVFDVSLRIYGQGKAYFKYYWNLFDFAIVALVTITFIPDIIPIEGSFAFLRLFRVIRVLLIFSKINQVQDIIDGLRKAIPGMWAVFLILSLVFFMFAVLGKELFGELNEKLFGDLGRSAYSLFQVMTLEGWSEVVVRPIMNVYPLAWLYFIPFILVTAFIILNLLIAIIVSAMEQVRVKKIEEQESESEMISNHILDEIQSLRKEVKKLESKLNVQDS